MYLIVATIQVLNNRAAMCIVTFEYDARCLTWQSLAWGLIPVFFEQLFSPTLYVQIDLNC